MIGYAGSMLRVTETCVRHVCFAHADRFFGGERFIYRARFVAQSAGQQARDGIENQRGGEFAARENEISDGNFVSGEVLGYSLVDSFVAAADQDEALEFRGEARGRFPGGIACRRRRAARRAVDGPARARSRGRRAIPRLRKEARAS